MDNFCTKKKLKKWSDSMGALYFRVRTLITRKRQHDFFRKSTTDGG